MPRGAQSAGESIRAPPIRVAPLLPLETVPLSFHRRARGILSTPPALWAARIRRTVTRPTRSAQRIVHTLLPTANAARLLAQRPDAWAGCVAGAPESRRAPFVLVLVVLLITARGGTARLGHSSARSTDGVGLVAAAALLERALELQVRRAQRRLATQLRRFRAKAKPAHRTHGEHSAAGLSAVEAGQAHRPGRVTNEGSGIVGSAAALDGSPAQERTSRAHSSFSTSCACGSIFGRRISTWSGHPFLR